MVKCKFCGSENVVKSGIVLGKQRHKCKDCSRQFIPGEKKSYTDAQKLLAYTLRINGVKLIEVAREIGAPGTGNVLQILRSFQRRHILIATQNQRKQTELKRNFAPRGVRVITPDFISLYLPSVEETEDSFVGNALLKARAACKFSKLPSVADDSGLCVDALGGEPGVFSARFAGEHGDDSANIQLLLEKLKDIPPEERTARFVCAAVCVYPDGTELVAEGVCEGKIALAPKGKGGFGYDPVFIPNGAKRTMAQLCAEDKDAISHRGKALEQLRGLVQDYRLSLRAANRGSAD
jgi:XTP/dITP diphosphohydrolase